MVTPQCGRCGGIGGPHTCLRDEATAWVDHDLPPAPRNYTYWRDTSSAHAKLLDDLDAAKTKLAKIRELVISPNPAARLYKMLQIIDGDE